MLSNPSHPVLSSIIASILLGVVYCQSNKLIVNCLNRADNTGRFFVNTFFTDTSSGFRAQALHGVCAPGIFVTFNLDELIGYAWIKGESSQKAYFEVTSQQTINNVYTYQTWSYQGNKAFVVSSDDISVAPSYPGFPKFSKCDKDDGRDGNGYCELQGPIGIPFTTIIPYQSTLYDVSLTPVSSASAFQGLEYKGVTKGGGIYGQYSDYRNNKWNSDNCYTFKAIFSDNHTCEITCPVKDYRDGGDAKVQASILLNTLGQIPRYARSMLVTIAVNGDGPGSDYGSNLQRKSITINLSNTNRNNAYRLFLYMGGNIGLQYINDSQKWKDAQTLDGNYISTSAKTSSSDVSECFIAWLKVRKEPISSQSLVIKKVIPNRLACFNDLILTRFPPATEAQ